MRVNGLTLQGRPRIETNTGVDWQLINRERRLREEKCKTCTVRIYAMQTQNTICAECRTPAKDR